LTHQWGFVELEGSICEFLKANLQVGNVCAVLDTGLAYSLNSLVNTCAVFADTNAGTVLDHPSFMNLSPVSHVIGHERHGGKTMKMKVICPTIP